MSRLLITNAHLLHPEDGTRTDPGWLEAADGRITSTGTGRPPAAASRAAARAATVEMNPSMTTGTRYRAQPR